MYYRYKVISSPNLNDYRIIFCKYIIGQINFVIK